MSTTATPPRAARRTKAPADRPAPAPPRLALIAGSAEPAARIAELLREHGFEVSAEDGLPALAEQTPIERSPALVALCTLETGVKLGKSVEPLRKRFPQTPIVLLCPTIRRWELSAALAGGVVGVVLFEEIDRALPACVNAVLAEQVCVPRRHAGQIEPPALSTREKQILGLVVMGYMNSQIAEQLFLAESTVKSHLSSAFGKLGVRSRNEAVHLILNPDGGLGLGILGLGAERLGPEEPIRAAAADGEPCESARDAVVGEPQTS